MRPARGSVERAARIAGLRDFETPTLEGVERRRLQLWILTLLLLTSLCSVLVFLAFWRHLQEPVWLTPQTVRGSLLVLVFLLSAYAVEKELQLRRLTRLLVEERVLTTALTSRLHEVSALLEAGRAVNLDLALDEVLQTILRCARELLSGRDASIMIVHGDRELRTVAVEGESAARGARVRLGEEIAGRVAERREPLLINGTIDRVGLERPKAPPRPSSAMSVPLLHREQLLGVLNINAPEGRTYTEHDLRALSLFGEHAAAAIANAQLYEAQRLAASQTAFRALHDPLTNLPNRVLLHDRLSHALARGGPGATALLLLDLDDFKRINDTRGHAAGDELLVAFAGRLRAVVGDGDTVGRLGGDEFAVLIEGLAGPEAAIELAERLLAAIGDPFPVEGEPTRVTARVGMALAEPGDEPGAEILMRRADAALLSLKARGQGGVSIFNRSLHADFLVRFDFEEELRRALAAGELAPYYQPIVDLSRRRIVGLEALLRWGHPRRGVLSPSSFLPVAEQLGLLPELDRGTLARSLELAATLGDARQPPTLFINLTPQRLEEADFVDEVEAELARTGVPAERLVLEITENVVLRQSDVAVARLDALKALGVRLALDDFGTGYSSLSYLRRCPVDLVKVDRAFIESLDEPGEPGALVEAIVRFGLGLSLEVIAEGVETEAQIERLLELGCHLGQGYLLSPPMPASEVRTLVLGGLAGRSGRA